MNVRFMDGPCKGDRAIGVVLDDGRNTVWYKDGVPHEYNVDHQSRAYYLQESQGA